MALETQQKKFHTKIPLQSGDIVSSSGYIQKVVNVTQGSKGNQAEMEPQKYPLPKSLQLHVKVELLRKLYLVEKLSIAACNSNEVFGHVCKSC